MESIGGNLPSDQTIRTNPSISAISCARHRRQIQTQQELCVMQRTLVLGLNVWQASTSTQAKGDGVFVSRVQIGSVLGSSTNLDLITAGDGTANTLMVTEKCGTAVSPTNAIIWSS